MEPSRQEQVPAPNSDAREVRSYLFKLIALIVLGAAFMTTVAVIAWHRYAAGVVDGTTPAPPPVSPPEGRRR